MHVILGDRHTGIVYRGRGAGWLCSYYNPGIDGIISTDSGNIIILELSTQSGQDEVSVFCITIHDSAV
jgi:hypothetical protein